MSFKSGPSFSIKLLRNTAKAGQDPKAVGLRSPDKGIKGGSYVDSATIASPDLFSVECIPESQILMKTIVLPVDGHNRF